MNGHIVAIGMFLGSYAALGLACSALVGIALRHWNRAIHRFPAEAQSRLYVAGALTPGFVAAAVAAGSIADWLISGRLDVCRSYGEMAQAPSILLTSALAFTAARACTYAFRVVKAQAALRRIRRTCPDIGVRQDGVRIVASEIPQAFVTGVLFPRVHVTTALLDLVGDDELRLILSHEAAHVRRRDPLRRVVALGGFVLHWPFVARFIARHLADAQEAAADDHAAADESGRLNLAELLVNLGRMNLPATAQSFEFAQGNLDSRVHRLLAPKPYSPALSLRLFLLTGGGVLVSAVAAGRVLHWTVQAITHLP
jgi:Zn-dependent protease with chaperone function